MARKGSTPAGQVRTQEENDRYNEWQKQSRARNKNHYARAYRRGHQRAFAWFRENMPEMWEQILAEELAKIEGEEYCRHENVTVETQVRIRCLDCQEWVRQDGEDETEQVP